MLSHAVCSILLSACLIKEQSELLTAEGIVLLLARALSCHPRQGVIVYAPHLHYDAVCAFYGDQTCNTGVREEMLAFMTLFVMI